MSKFRFEDTEIYRDGLLYSALGEAMRSPETTIKDLADITHRFRLGIKISFLSGAEDAPTQDAPQ